MKPLLGFIFVLFASLFISCNNEASGRLIIWTDRPEFAIYTEYFNSSQDRFKAEVRYFDSPARRLSETGEIPDIVVASWLNSASTRNFFLPLNDYISRSGLDRSAFYPQLLDLGRINNSQYLLPVSFNLPSIVFARDLNNVSLNPFIVELEEIRDRAKNFDIEENGAYTRIGLSLLYNDEFLYITSDLFGAGFREASPLAWNTLALESAISWLKDWFEDGNSSIEMEDDFAFKYFHDPPDRLVNSGRILYTYMDSSEFFTFPEERRMNLNFRWLGANQMIPLIDGGVYYGIHRRTGARRGAEAFTSWFFSEETQRQLLEVSNNMRLNELYFGIAGGFSAMRTVNERIFPQFYPSLLGHMPTENYLSPPNILPRNWIAIKERVAIPYLQERIRESADIRPLETRIGDWHRLNWE